MRLIFILALIAIIIVTLKDNKAKREQELIIEEPELVRSYPDSDTIAIPPIHKTKFKGKTISVER